MMLLTMLGSLDITSVIPATYRASTSLVLQTTILAGATYILVKLLFFYLRIRRNIKLFGELPGPTKSTFLRGNFCDMPDDAEARLNLFLEWGDKYSKEKGFIRVFSVMYKPLLVACHPYSMKKILKTAEPKPLNTTGGYRTLYDWLGDGLLIARGEKWARNRRLLTPAFHFDILKPYLTVYNDSTSVFAEKLGVFADEKQTFELFQHVCQCTLDIILKCAFSYEINVQTSKETHPYVIAVNELATTASQRARNPLHIFNLTFYSSAIGRKYKKNCDYVHSVAEEIINKRRQVLANDGDALKGRKYLDFLDILLTAKDEKGAGLSDLDIRNEVDTFLFEGHDTTASAISWILYSLAEHPEYQKKCQEEIDDVLAGRDSDGIEWADLSKLEFLTQCIKEGMRLHAPVAIIGRETTKDFEMGGTVFPPGTSIMINIWMLHHNEEVWGKDHMEFKPDRFTKDNIAKMDPYQFVPFSGGPRNCIGQNFAMNEEKVVIAKLLHNFTFKLDPNHKVKRRLAAVMRSDGGIMMTVERRKH